MRPVLAAALIVLLGTTAPRAAEPQPPGDPAARLFAASASRWREAYDQRVRERDRMGRELSDLPETVTTLRAHFKEAADSHRTQLALLQKLTANQERAVKDGVLTKETFEKHYERLTRVMDERLLRLWGGLLPARWNDDLRGLEKARRPSGYPFPVYPSEKEYQRYRSKDFTPVYDPATRQMRSVKPEEAFR